MIKSQDHHLHTMGSSISSPIVPSSINDKGKNFDCGVFMKKVVPFLKRKRKYERRSIEVMICNHCGDNSSEIMKVSSMELCENCLNNQMIESISDMMKDCKCSTCPKFLDIHEATIDDYDRCGGNVDTLSSIIKSRKIK